MNIDIPFNRPFIVGKELYYISQSVIHGKISGDGIFSQRCSALLEKNFSLKKVLLTTSCTSALEMTALLCGIEEGDEVIMPSYTFVSTANAFYRCGAKLKFVDIRPDTLNINEKLLEDAITDRTKVIVPVHYAGVSCEMDKIISVANKYNLKIVEDAAQGVNAKYKGRYLGSIGDMGTYSFHETKNFSCGEGGALVLNKPEYIERAEIIREKGTNRTKYMKGETDKYTWVDVGSSYLSSDLLAAFLYAQLEHMEVITKRRKEIYNLYYELLKPLSERGEIRLPIIPSDCDSNYHMFYIIVGNIEVRAMLIENLKIRGINSVFHYVPLHSSPIGKNIGYENGMLPVTEDMSDRLLRLPFYYELTMENIVTICSVINECFSYKKVVNF